jgi:heat shock protein HslJ
MATRLIAAAVLLLSGGCTRTVTADPVAETYSARGQEPGWALAIAGGRIDYRGNYGDKRIEVALPRPQARADGRRYQTPRLTVDISHHRCNDAMSGHGYADQVTVTADGETFEGCGGTRRTDWDL